MKKIIFLVLISFAASSLMAEAASRDIKDILKAVNKTAATSTDSAATTQSNGGGLGSLLSGVANKFGIGASSLTVEKIAGRWNYSGPAVSFKSDNLLLKAGGAAAATQVEAKLAPYYKTVGFTSLVLTIEQDSTFTFKAGLINLSGNITKEESAENFTFHFKALGKVNVGSMESYIVMNGETMELTFDVSGLMSLIDKAGKLTGKTSLKAVSAILNKYDGMTAGFELKRQQKTQK
ncbi:MAG: DUF4923 family protein [Bacteroides sp.]|nr:DUF4923 family protein [Bacteroides sp.]